MSDLLDQVAERILKTRSKRTTSLVLVNEATKQYTVIDLPVGWQITDRQPFDLQRDGYEFLSKWQAGICPQEVDDR